MKNTCLMLTIALFLFAFKPEKQLNYPAYKCEAVLNSKGQAIPVSAWIKADGVNKTDTLKVYTFRKGYWQERSFILLSEYSLKFIGQWKRSTKQTGDTIYLIKIKNQKHEQEKSNLDADQRNG